MEKLYKYTKSRCNVEEEVKEIILKTIEEAMSKFWDDYENESICDDDLQTLDIRKLFSEYTPGYDSKSYLEGQKLFHRIAPYFNTKDRYDKTDVDFLCKFITEINKALEIQINLEQTVDNLVCDYIVESVQKEICKSDND